MGWMNWLRASPFAAGLRRWRRGTVAPVGPTPADTKSAGSVSVVLGSFNRRALLEIAIDSTRRELDGIPHEIIVVDGGSSDGSLPWLLAQKDIVTIVQHNRGEFNGQALRRRSWGYFINLGFKCAQGEWVLMISDDCLLLPGAIANSLATARRARAEGRRVGAVAYYFRNWPQDQRYYVQKTIGGRLTVNHGLFLNQALRDVGYANEDDYEFYKADGDLNLRIWAAGYEILAAESSFVEHYMDEAEAVRMENNTVLARDRAAFHRLWPDLVSGETPSRVYSEHRDVHDAAASRFAPLRDPSAA